jgi:ABC-2 type transport system ATP-binding protein
VIEINDLHKYYGPRKAIGPLSFSIADGEIVGLLGLNGAGKTTTLRVLACDLLPSAGSVRVDGLDVVDSPDEVRARIGYLPDVPPLYPDMTVRDYLLFAARLRGMSRADAEKRLPEVEDATQLGAVADDPIASLSHGFKQRVGIAQAIVHRPKLLVLDEPISGLDPVQIVEMRELLRGLRGDHTILLSSHILSEISETCDRILVIRDGAIAASGTEAELTAKLAGYRVELTVRVPPGDLAAADVRALLASQDGVTSVEELPPAEVGAGITSFRIETTKDAREPLSSAIVGKGVGLLEMRSERALERAFLELAGPSAAETKGRRERASARKAARRAEKAELAEKASAAAGDAKTEPPAEGGREET